MAGGSYCLAVSRKGTWFRFILFVFLFFGFALFFCRSAVRTCTDSIKETDVLSSLAFFFLSLDHRCFRGDLTTWFKFSFVGKMDESSSGLRPNMTFIAALLYVRVSSEGLVRGKCWKRKDFSEILLSSCSCRKEAATDGATGAIVAVRCCWSLKNTFWRSTCSIYFIFLNHSTF